MEIKINDKIVDRSSIEIDGIDTQDYPDFCDAYIFSLPIFCRGKYFFFDEILSKKIFCPQR